MDVWPELPNKRKDISNPSTWVGTDVLYLLLFDKDL
jgi:hypothetical protein